MSREEYLTPRDHFGPSQQVYGRVFRTDGGIYLLVAPHLGPGDPVFAVGWGCNDYWAVRAWGFDGNGYRSECDPAAPVTTAPSLESLGWPDPLRYAETLACAKKLAGAPVMVTAGYRLTDGGFESHVIRAAPRVEFHYADPNPGPDDAAIAVCLGLGGPRWEQHLAEIRAINQENGARRV